MLKKYHWFEGDIKASWNSTQENWINSEEEDAEEKIGSVFAEPRNFHNINGKFSADEYNKENLHYLF